MIDSGQDRLLFTVRGGAAYPLGGNTLSLTWPFVLISGFTEGLAVHISPKWASRISLNYINAGLPELQQQPHTWLIVWDELRQVDYNLRSVVLVAKSGRGIRFVSREAAIQMIVALAQENNVRLHAVKTTWKAAFGGPP